MTIRQNAVGPVLVVAAAVAAAVGTTVTAHAAGAPGVVKVDADRLQFVAGQTVANQVVITAQEGKISIRDGQAPVKLDSSARAAGCSTVDTNTVSCATPARLWVQTFDLNDRVTITFPGTVTVEAGAGADLIDARQVSGRTKLFGEAGNDTIHGGTAEDVVQAGPGHNTVHGYQGNDILSGHNGRDTLEGGPDQDNLFGLGDVDIMRGGPGGDKLFGGSGDDELRGDAGRDFLRGDEGDDELDAGPSRDEHNDGGPDSDHCVGLADVKLNCES